LSFAIPQIKTDLFLTDIDVGCIYLVSELGCIVGTFSTVLADYYGRSNAYFVANLMFAIFCFGLSVS